MVSIQEWEKIVNLISRLHQLKDNTHELRDYVLFHFPQFQNKSTSIDKEWLAAFETNILIKLEEATVNNKDPKMRELLEKLDELISLQVE